MRLQLVDESARFDCGSCTFCCDQPWRTMIEVDKAEALDRHDFGAYPQLEGKPFYRKSADRRKGLYELAKGEGTKCLFLDTDGLCIIHKELGPQAKPHMCRQFPFLSARNWVDDRVSANFGCPSIQNSSGRPLTEQSEEIAALVSVSEKPARPDAPVLLDLHTKVTQAESDAIMDRALAIFDETGRGDIWTRFAELVSLLNVVRSIKLQSMAESTPDDLLSRLQADGPLAGSPEVEEVSAFPTVAAAPMPVRMLFAATLQPDTVPPDAGSGLGFFKRLTLIPKLMALATLSGGYASRVLGRNVSITDVLKHEVDERLDPEATALLLRYYRSRFWQRTIAGTRLPIIGAVHQHIHDLNAIIFLARAEAAARGCSRLDADLIRKSLTCVEFHLANQARLYDHTLKGWLRTQLCDSDLAMQSLRLMVLCPPKHSGSAEVAGSGGAELKQ